MFEQEERDAGGTEGYEEEALADNEEEGDTVRLMPVTEKSRSG